MLSFCELWSWECTPEVGSVWEPLVPVALGTQEDFVEAISNSVEWFAKQRRRLAPGYDCIMHILMGEWRIVE